MLILKNYSFWFLVLVVANLLCMIIDSWPSEANLYRSWSSLPLFVGLSIVDLILMVMFKAHNSRIPILESTKTVSIWDNRVFDNWLVNHITQCLAFWYKICTVACTDERGLIGLVWSWLLWSNLVNYSGITKGKEISKEPNKWALLVKTTQKVKP